MIISHSFKSNLLMILCWNVCSYGMDVKVREEQPEGKKDLPSELRVQRKKIKNSKCSPAKLMTISFLGLALGGAGGYLVKRSNEIVNPGKPHTIDESFFCAYSDGTFAGKGDVNAVHRNWHVELTNCGGWLNATSQVQTELISTFNTPSLAIYAYSLLDFCNTPNQKTAYCVFLDSAPANQTDNLGAFMQNIWNALKNGNGETVNFKDQKKKKAKAPKKSKKDLVRMNQGRKR